MPCNKYMQLFSNCQPLYIWWGKNRGICNCFYINIIWNKTLRIFLTYCDVVSVWTFIWGDFFLRTHLFYQLEIQTSGKFNPSLWSVLRWSHSFIKRPNVIKEYVAFPLSFIFCICTCGPFSTIPSGKGSQNSRRSNFQEVGEVWMRARGSRRVATEEEEAGIWLCWISSRCAVCWVMEVRWRQRRRGCM